VPSTLMTSPVCCTVMVCGSACVCLPHKACRCVPDEIVGDVSVLLRDLPDEEFTPVRNISVISHP
jgi:hypothetical protein